MSKRLLVLAGPDEGRVFPLHEGETVLLGRSRATETRLIDPHVSRVHCQVQMENRAGPSSAILTAPAARSSTARRSIDSP
jgi:hypothetical protein